MSEVAQLENDQTFAEGVELDRRFPDVMVRQPSRGLEARETLEEEIERVLAGRLIGSTHVGADVGILEADPEQRGSLDHDLPEPVDGRGDEVRDRVGRRQGPDRVGELDEGTVAQRRDHRLLRPVDAVDGAGGDAAPGRDRTDRECGRPGADDDAFGGVEQMFAGLQVVNPWPPHAADDNITLFRNIVS